MIIYTEKKLYSLQVFSRPSNVVLYGLFTASDRPNRPFIVTTEQTISAPVPTICVNVLRRNALGQLAIVQEMKLHESSTNPWTTFASGPNGNVFCAIWGSNSVHQMCRARAPGVAAVAAPFAEVSTRAHRLSATVYYIGGLECDGEQRLVGSFADKSVRVFREASGELCEVQRVAAPANNWSPNTLVGLSDDGICVRSYHTDSADLTQAFTIELCAADTSGALSSSRRLAKFVNHVEVWCHLRAPYAFDSSHRIVVAEYVNATTVALRLFHIQEC